MLNNFLKLISSDLRCDLRTANMLGNLLQNCLFSSKYLRILLAPLCPEFPCASYSANQRAYTLASSSNSVREGLF